MDLDFTAEELAFRDDVRGYIRDQLDPAIKAKMSSGRHLAKADFVAWQKKLAARGWMAPHWPKAYGGAGWSPIQQFIFDEEIAFGGAPPVPPFGVSMVAPVIIAFGTEAQKQTWLPRILSSEDWWCQGYSEPGAGSDLAGLKTRAVRDGDDYVVTGQKTWTTLAQHANMMFCLVRTDPAAKKQEGISFLLIDMSSPGVTVRPIITLDGGHEVNEVFLDEVRVPAANLIGKENEGWTCAKYLLSYERAGIAGVGRSKQQVARLKSIAAAELDDGRPLIEYQQFREKVAAIEIALMALEMTALRVLSADAHGGSPGPESSILKIKGSEIQQSITELMVEAVGPYAMPFIAENWEGGNLGPIGPEYAASLAPTYFNYRKTTIYGGSNEIQKNVIAKMILGL